MRSILKQLFKNLANVFVTPADLHGANMEFAEDRSSTLFANWHTASSKTTPLKAHTDLPNITICGVTLNSEKWLEAFLESVCALNYPREHISIHFVDHGSTDETLARLTGFISQQDLGFLSLKVDRRPNAGYGAGNDYAIRQAKGEFVLVTNVDVEFYTDSLKTIVNVAIHDAPNVASWEFRQCPYEHPKYYDPVTQLSGWASHACVLLRQAAYLEVGGYDKNIFMYGEDVELSYRLRNKGWHLRYVPKAVIRHHVNLNDLSARPYQLSGSIGANILLRRRYGTRLDRMAGALMLWSARVRETEPDRKQAFKDARQIYKENRLNFDPIPQEQTGVKFQFNQFDYGRRRAGAALPHHSANDPNLPIVRILTAFEAPLTQAFKDTVATVLNQTYENVEYVIIRENDDDSAGFFTNLKSAYGGKVKYVKPCQVLESSDNDRFRYLCWLESGDLLFSDHIELLTLTLEKNEKVVAAQSYAWTESGGNVPSLALVLRNNYFTKTILSADMTELKHKVTELRSKKSERLLCLPKTTSIIQTTT